jgi:hypothetical protein
VRYELGSHIPQDDVLHIHRCENIKSYTQHMFSNCIPQEMNKRGDKAVTQLLKAPYQLEPPNISKKA